MQEHSFKSSVKQGISAVRANLLPGIILQICALGLLLSYYFIPPVTDALKQLAQLKVSMGIWFAAISTTIFGGLIPFIIQQIFNPPHLREKLKYLPIVILFWVEKGIEVDLFYKLQATLFGDDNDLSTVVTKLLVDQLGYTPIIGLTSVILFYILKDCNFKLKKTWQVLKDSFFYDKFLPQLLCGWSIWVPGVAIIYNLPTPLQLPLQNILLCLQVLLVIFLSRKAVEDTLEHTAPPQENETPLQR